MKMTFVLPYAGMAGGIRVLAIYADRLMRRGHDVFVISQHLRTVPVRRKVKSFLLGRGWPESPMPEPSYFAGLSVPHRVMERYRPIEAADVPDADVVVATHWTTAPWVAKFPAGKGAKAIFIQGYEVVPGERLPALDESWRMPFHKITISRWLVDLAARQFGDNDVSHVPNSVDLDLFNAPPRRKQLCPTVGLLYSTSPFKACEVGLRAVELAARKLPTLKLVAFGADKLTGRLPLPLGTELHYRPPQERLKTIYAGCDVWLCSSRREGFHLPPLEAMACRCPVVATRVGGPMDIIEEGVNGYLVDTEDSAGLADRLVRVLQLPDDQWQAMSDAAYATATRYTWDDATVLLEAALQMAVERGRCGELQISPAAEVAG